APAQARLQPAHAPKPERTAARLCRQTEIEPDPGGVGRELKRWRHDADDGDGLLVERKDAADGIGLCPQHVAPEAIAHHRHRSAPAKIVARTEAAAEQRSDSKCGENAGGGERALLAARHGDAGEIKLAAGSQAEIAE